ncbi:lactate utilization protein [Rhodoplanes sp. TEM]|uniref:Lactate utilization protein n=1 Tax=Rhodoplanes tepidamans TaxID=200616 RepID=A0ABT5JA83_RHOTP|nr:lactate utilization protein [Rhodoplanes tepidamans]MDC7786306.1 lactate utilization protein [Rhodoplanes tepidamans]MDC7986655.1 lactate utilization protein [Rhodoplanes sp. TEM]MDQ0354049.1 L-lactate dehydrogenase complex protein LldG [Rhodoplanes tepidamans]
MSARDQVLGAIRRALAVTGEEPSRRKIVADRLADHPCGVIPARGQLLPAARLALFQKRVELVAGTVARVATAEDVPAAVAAYLRADGLPPAVRRGADPRLGAMPWEREPSLAVAVGASAGDDLVGVSHAVAAVAETGTLVLLSGPDNPTTLNFLPDHHLVVVDAATVAGDLETVLSRLRDTWGQGGGPGGLPRNVHLITGPSRTADIEQTLILGAHGPRRLHVILVGEP